MATLSSFLSIFASAYEIDNLSLFFFDKKCVCLTFFESSSESRSPWLFLISLLPRPEKWIMSLQIELHSTRPGQGRAPTRAKSFVVGSLSPSNQSLWQPRVDSVPWSTLAWNRETLSFLFLAHFYNLLFPSGFIVSWKQSKLNVKPGRKQSQSFQFLFGERRSV